MAGQWLLQFCLSLLWISVFLFGDFSHFVIVNSRDCYSCCCPSLFPFDLINLCCFMWWSGFLCHFSATYVPPLETTALHHEHVTVFFVTFSRIKKSHIASMLTWDSFLYSNTRFPLSPCLVTQTVIREYLLLQELGLFIQSYMDGAQK